MTRPDGATGLGRKAAAVALLLALSAGLGVQAAALSLSDVKIKARTSADEWEYQTLTDGADRTKKSDHKWLIHIPHYFYPASRDDLDLDLDGTSNLWPSNKRPTKAQLWKSNANWGGLFDYAGSNRYWYGLREWTIQGSGYDNFPSTASSREDAYNKWKTWWRGSNGMKKVHDDHNKFPPDQVDKWMMSKNLYQHLSHATIAWWPEKLDVVAAETGENAVALNMHLAFTRGAGRQYSKPWASDYSDWWGGFLSDYGGWWQTAAEEADACWEVETNGGVLAWRTSGNASYWKAPGTADALSLASNVLELKVGNSAAARFVIRTAGYVTVGGHSNLPLSRCCNWTNALGNGSDSGVGGILAVNGDRIAALSKNGQNLWVYSAHWKKFAATYGIAGEFANAWLAGNHVVALLRDGTLGRDTAPGIGLTGTLTTIDTGVADAALAGSRILYLKSGKLYYKADLTTGAPVEVRSGAAADNSAGISDFALVEHGGAVRIGVLYNNGALRVGATPASIAASTSKLLEHVVRFELDGNRIAAVQEGDEGMQVLKVRASLTGSWVPMMFVRMADFGISSGSDGNALFVHTERDHKILVKNRGLEEMEYSGTDSSDQRNFKENYNLWSFADTSQWASNKTWASQLWGGHSESLMRRHYYASYMGGANILYEEAGGIFFFLGRANSLTKNTDGVEVGVMTLSREGVLAKHYYNFTKRVLPHAERGIPWAPIGIMLDHYHGMTYSANNYVFKILAQTAPDRMNRALMNSLWPGGVNRSWTRTNEYKFQLNAPYGELFDILTDWASADVIANYPVLLLSGEISPDATLRTRLKNYVNGGGNLLINSAMDVANFEASFTGVTLGTAAIRSVPGLRWKIDDVTATFSSARNVSAQSITLSNGASALLETTDPIPVTLASIRTHGQGRVIVVGLPNLEDQQFWGFLLRKLSENPAVNPFKVDGDIMYQVNYKGADAWLVTLTNNRGVSKTAYDNANVLQAISASGTRGVTLALQEAGRDISSVTEYPIFHGIWKTPSGATPHANDAFTVTVDPGQTRVFEVVTEASSG